MATLQLNNIISGASKVVKGVLGNNQTVTKQPVMLTPKQQVERFLNMADSDLEAIRVQRGEYEYHRYLKTMLEKSKELYNG